MDIRMLDRLSLNHRPLTPKEGTEFTLIMDGERIYLQTITTSEITGESLRKIAGTFDRAVGQLDRASANGG